MNRLLSIAIALTILLCGGVAPALQAQPVTGAIFTTLGDGTAVNANHFESKCAVYLDGGPGPNAPAKAAGLPNGDYYFQVTDPSGKVLLSTDPVSNRKFKVDGGVIVAYTGTGDYPHPTDLDSDHGATTIRLANRTCESTDPLLSSKDFLDSPNNGGAYKVWATRVTDFVGDATLVDNDCGNGCYHGFLPYKSKTDNFKVKPAATFCLTIRKEVLNDAGEWVPTAEWPMYVTDSIPVTNRHLTGEAGEVKVCALTAGDYTVREETANSKPAALIVNGIALPFEPDVEPIYSFTWAPGKKEPIILFRNNLDTGTGPM